MSKAAELARAADAAGDSLGGLTLAEMKAAAAQVGFDPALVERAARLVSISPSASFLGRLIGGEPRHTAEVQFPIVLDEAVAAELLSVVQIGYGRPGSGHSSAKGLTWQTSNDVWWTLSVTARVCQDGTSLTMDLDRRGTLALTGILTLVGSIFVALAGFGLGSEVAPALGAVAALSGMGGVLALARRYWAWSSRAARDRVNRAMDYVDQLLARPGDTTSARGDVGDQGEATRTNVEPAGGAS